MKRGGNSWFFITADYAFGAALERDTAAVVKANGGTILGSVKAPLNTQDFSSFLLQAQSSGAKIVGLANAGGDTINSIKQAAEFGIVQGGQNLAGPSRLHHRHPFTGAEDGARADLHRVLLLGSERWDARLVRPLLQGDRPPPDHGAGRRLLRRSPLSEGRGRAQQCEDGKAVVAKMKETPTDDPLFGKGEVRADGRKIHDDLSVRGEEAGRSKGPWDYYKLLATIPADKAFRPLAEGGCPLVTAAK